MREKQKKAAEKKDKQMSSISISPAVKLNELMHGWMAVILHSVQLLLYCVYSRALLLYSVVTKQSVIIFEVENNF